jgi:hypothetical protein
MVIDGFYEDPTLVRDYALELEYYKGNRGSWPGLRSDYIQNLDAGLYDLLYKKLMKELLDKNIYKLRFYLTVDAIIENDTEDRHFFGRVVYKFRYVKH